MILHIFKKDCRLLWLWILAVAVVNLTSAAVWTASDVVAFRAEGLENPYAQAAWIESLITLLATAVLIAAAVHQDGLADPAPDCWTRPISRRDLVLAKILFALVAVQGPIFLGDFAHALVLGFPLGAATAAAAIKWLMMACSVSVLVIAIASTARTLTATIITAIVWFLIASLAANMLAPTIAAWRFETGLAWSNRALGGVLLIVGAGLTLALQYGSRRVWVARASLAVTLLALILTPLLPLQAYAAIQAWLAPGLPASAAITLLPTTGAVATTRILENAQYGSLEHVLLPLQISGLPAGSILMFDDAHIRMLDVDGNELYDRNMGRSFHVPAQGNDTRFDYPLTIPAEESSKIVKRTRRIEVTYALTVAAENAVYDVTAAPQVRYLKDVGWCKTKITSQGADIFPDMEVSCLNASRPPVCMAKLSQQFPGVYRVDCQPDYAPRPYGPQRVLRKDFDMWSPRNPPRLAPEHVSMALKTYVAVDHLVRTVTLDVTSIADR